MRRLTLASPGDRGDLHGLLAAERGPPAPNPRGAKANFHCRLGRRPEFGPCLWRVRSKSLLSSSSSSSLSILVFFHTGKRGFEDEDEHEEAAEPDCHNEGSCSGVPTTGGDARSG